MYTYNAKVTNVVDGDTIDVQIDLGFSIFINQRIRLNGINTPEIHSTNENEKSKGILAKLRLKELVDGKDIKLITIKKEKFGRMLGIIYINDQDINAQLIKEGLGISYFGEKR
jgi:micrococcal nuclease